MKKIAYGYKRSEAEFAHLEYDHLFLDTDKARPVLAETIRDFFYGGHGDILLLVDDADLPDRGPFKDALAAKEVAVQVEAVPGKRAPGRPSTYNPTATQDAEARKIWNTPYYREHAAGLIGDLVGYPVTRYTLERRYGKPDFNAQT